MIERKYKITHQSADFTVESLAASLYRIAGENAHLRTFIMQFDDMYKHDKQQAVKLMQAMSTRIASEHNQRNNFTFLPSFDEQTLEEYTSSLEMWLEKEIARRKHAEENEQKAWKELSDLNKDFLKLKDEFEEYKQLP